MRVALEVRANGSDAAAYTIDGGKGLTAGIRQKLIIRYPMIAVARKRLLATR